MRYWKITRVLTYGLHSVRTRRHPLSTPRHSFQPVSVAEFQRLLSHSRFLLTLRSTEGVYHSLILFRLSSGIDNAQLPDGSLSAEDTEKNAQLYAMEAQCPHLGADISHADIEECEDSVVLVCPWHRYA